MADRFAVETCPLGILCLNIEGLAVVGTGASVSIQQKASWQ